MANVCSFDMKVVGRYQDVCNFYSCLQGVDEFEDSQMSTRIYDADCWEVNDADTENSFMLISGSCAWSVVTAFIDRSSSPDEPTAVSFSKDCNLSLEFFSEECGLEFAEHYIIKDGKILVEEEVKYSEYYIEDVEDDPETFFGDEFVKEHGITKENYLEKFDGEDWLRLGGFEHNFTI